MQRIDIRASELRNAKYIHNICAMEVLHRALQEAGFDGWALRQSGVMCRTMGEGIDYPEYVIVNATGQARRICGTLKKHRIGDFIFDFDAEKPLNRDLSGFGFTFFVE